MTHAPAGEPIEVYFSETLDGTWVAATCASPFFFFEADTEQEIHNLVEDAIRFYSENRDSLPRESSFQEQARQLPTFNNVTKELLYA